jgi:hypothetical protein
VAVGVERFSQLQAEAARTTTARAMQAVPMLRVFIWGLLCVQHVYLFQVAIIYTFRRR